MRFLKIYTLIAFLFGFGGLNILFAQHSYAQTKSGNSNHPIDIKLKHCLEENYSIDGMVTCTNEALTAWDAEMNKYYKQLREVMDETSKESIKESQRDWLAFRDQENTFIDNMEKMLMAKAAGGTMYKFVSATQKMEVVKKRALELKGYYDYIISQGK